MPQQESGTSRGWKAGSFAQIPNEDDRIPLSVILAGKKNWTSWPSSRCGTPRDSVCRDWLFRLFISHVWECNQHPDPERRQLDAIRDFTREYVNQMTSCVRLNLYGEDLDQAEIDAIHPGFQSLSKRINSSLNAEHIRFFRSTNSLARQRQYLAENTGLWYDYELVPQKPHVQHCATCRQNQQKAIGSIISLTRMSMVVLVADDLQKALSRGWILSEVTTGNSSHNSWFWDQEERTLHGLNAFPYASRLMDPERSRFTNGSDGQKLRIMNFAMFCLEPNCYYGHVQYMLRLVGIDDVKVQGLPSVEKWKKAVCSEDLRMIRYEDEDFCKTIQDPRYRLRKIVNLLIQCNFETVPEARDDEESQTQLNDNNQYVLHQLQCAQQAAEEVMKDELAAGLICFPLDKDRIREAIKKRGELINLCLDSIAQILICDGDFREPYFAAKNAVVDMAKLLDQYRIVNGELQQVPTIRFLSDMWLKSANPRNCPDFVDGSQLLQNVAHAE